MSTPEKYFWTPKSSVGIEEYVNKVSHPSVNPHTDLSHHQSRPSIVDDHDTPVSPASVALGTTDDIVDMGTRI